MHRFPQAVQQRRHQKVLALLCEAGQSPSRQHVCQPLSEGSASPAVCGPLRQMWPQVCCLSVAIQVLWQASDMQAAPPIFACSSEQAKHFCSLDLCVLAICIPVLHVQKEYKCALPYLAQVIPQTTPPRVMGNGRPAPVADPRPVRLPGIVVLLSTRATLSCFSLVRREYAIQSPITPA